MAAEIDLSIKLPLPFPHLIPYSTNEQDEEFQIVQGIVHFYLLYPIVAIQTIFWKSPSELDCRLFCNLDSIPSTPYPKKPPPFPNTACITKSTYKLPLYLPWTMTLSLLWVRVATSYKFVLLSCTAAKYRYPVVIMKDNVLGGLRQTRCFDTPRKKRKNTLLCYRV